MQKDKVYVNGRFVTQSVTGVQRVAWETVARLAKICNVVLLIPKNTDNLVCKELSERRIEFKKVGRLSGILWEQVSLPFYVGNNLLVNFGNLAPFFKRNQIVYIHDLAVRDAPAGFTGGFRLFYRIAYRLETIFSKQIVTVSRFSRSRILNYYPVSKMKTSIIYPGVTHIESSENLKSDMLKKWGIEPYNYSLVVGSNNPNKNISHVISTFMNNQDLTLAVAGGNFGKVFGNDEQDISVSSNILRLGYVSDLELRTLYRYAACFIFASKYEGFGIPPAEALLSGTPVIAFDILVLREIYTNKVHYFSNPEALISMTRAILKSKERVEKETIESLTENYSWDTAAEKLHQIIMTIQKGHK